jgi:hypothetical protein
MLDSNYERFTHPISNLAVPIATKCTRRKNRSNDLSNGIISLLMIVNQRRSTNVTEMSAICELQERVIFSDFLQKV